MYCSPLLERKNKKLKTMLFTKQQFSILLNK
jgi:hypothetical protein